MSLAQATSTVPTGAAEAATPGTVAPNAISDALIEQAAITVADTKRFADTLQCDDGR